MAKVYIVYERLYRKAYYAEPHEEERIVKVFDDYNKTVDYICDAINKFHKEIDESNGDLTHWHKYEPNPDRFMEGRLISSVEYTDKNYYDSLSYRFRSYEVE